MQSLAAQLQQLSHLDGSIAAGSGGSSGRGSTAEAARPLFELMINVAPTPPADSFPDGVSSWTGAAEVSDEGSGSQHHLVSEASGSVCHQASGCEAQPTSPAGRHGSSGGQRAAAQAEGGRRRRRRRRVGAVAVVGAPAPRLCVSRPGAENLNQTHHLLQVNSLYTHASRDTPTLTGPAGVKQQICQPLPC